MKRKVNSMVLFCFKNIRFAKFIKQHLRMNIEFSKTGTDKDWEKKVEGLVLPLVPIRIACCPVWMSASRGTNHLTDTTTNIFNERTAFFLFVWRSIHLLSLERANGKLLNHPRESTLNCRGFPQDLFPEGEHEGSHKHGSRGASWCQYA